MPSVTITLTDTPAGTVAVHSDYVPALGAKTSLAQTAAQDIINRTCREYGLPNPLQQVSPVLRAGVDIDAVHRTRDNVVFVQSTGHANFMPGASQDRRFFPAGVNRRPGLQELADKISSENGTWSPKRCLAAAKSQITAKS